MVLGCESKLSNSIATYGIFPENYTVFCKDRTASGGGVFIATKDSLITAEESDLDDNCEITASIEISNSKRLLLASYYRPPDSKVQLLDSMISSFNKCINKNKRQHPNVIIGGDFNMSDMNWDNWTVKNYSKSHRSPKVLGFFVE